MKPMGFLKQEVPVIDFAQWSKGTRAERIRRWPGTGPKWDSVPGGTSPVLRSEDPGVRLRRALLALATDGIDGLGNIGSWWSGTDRVPEGRAVHHVVRGGRIRLRLRAVEQPLLSADGFCPVLAASQDDSASAVALDSADQRDDA